MGGCAVQFGGLSGIRAMCAASALVILLGCGSQGDGRVAVSGQVTFDGQPLTTGQVVFEPRGQGRMAIGQLVNGSYSIAAERGPTAGEYVVRITSARPTGEKASGGPTSRDEMRDVYQQFLPPKYNDASELLVQIDAAATEVEQNFDLKSQ